MTDLDKYESYQRHVSNTSQSQNNHRYWSSLEENFSRQGCFGVSVGSSSFAHSAGVLNQSMCSEEQWSKLNELVKSIIKENKEKTFVDFIASVKTSVKGIEAEVLGE